MILKIINASRSTTFYSDINRINFNRKDWVYDEELNKEYGNNWHVYHKDFPNEIAHGYSCPIDEWCFDRFIERCDIYLISLIRNNKFFYIALNDKCEAYLINDQNGKVIETLLA